MSEQEPTTPRDDAPATEADSLALDPSLSFKAEAAAPEPVETPEPLPAISPVVLEPSMRGAERAVEETTRLPQEAPADETALLETRDCDPAESMWAAVRDRGRVLTGEEVELPGEITPEDDIVGEPVPVETGQIEPVTVGSHTTTIPVMTGQVPVVAPADPTPTPRDVLANRSDAETAPVAPSPSSDPLAETSVQRRSLVSANVAIEEPEPEASWLPREEARDDAFVPATPRSLDDTIFEGATLRAEVPSRTGAHWAGLLGHLLLVPVAWFLLADAGARLTLSDNAPMTTGVLSPLALGEFAGGVLVLLLLLVLLARKSSLGLWFAGVLIAIAGLPWLALPRLTAETLLPLLRDLDSWNAFGANLSHHLQASGYSGRLLILGLALMGAGLISHSVRRIGRNEEALRAEVEKVNPVGAHFTAGARRRAAKAAGLR